MERMSERDRDLGEPEHLALDDARPDRLTSSLRGVDLRLPEEVKLIADGRPPRAEDREGRGEERGNGRLDGGGVLLGLGLVAVLAEVVPARLPQAPP